MTEICGNPVIEERRTVVQKYNTQCYVQGVGSPSIFTVTSTNHPHHPRQPPLRISTTYYSHHHHPYKAAQPLNLNQISRTTLWQIGYKIISYTHAFSTTTILYRLQNNGKQFCLSLLENEIALATILLLAETQKKYIISSMSTENER